MKNNPNPHRLFVILALAFLLPSSGSCFYNSSTGRWLNRDPLEEEGGQNLYTAAGNDALNRVDPFGAKDTLTYADSRVTAKECGEFEWYVKFQIKPAPKGSGSIIQHMNWNFDVKDCQSKKVDIDSLLAAPSSVFASYWEGWDVWAGSTSDDYWKNPSMGNDTWGTITITGVAEYYPEKPIKMYPPFTLSRPTPAANLPWTPQDPKYTGSTATLKRTLTATWDCCCTMFPENRKTKVTIK